MRNSWEMFRYNFFFVVSFILPPLSLCPAASENAVLSTCTIVEMPIMKINGHVIKLQKEDTSMTSKTEMPGKSADEYLTHLKS